MIYFIRGEFMNYSTIIVAAGMGTRAKLGYNKAYFKFDNGNTILDETMNVFLNDDRCKQIIIVCDIQDYKANIQRDFSGNIVLVSGGKTRQESVYNGMHAVNEDVVFVHDGARPFLTKKVIDDILITMENNDACCVMVPVKDTLKKVIDGVIVETIDREVMRHAQTPQVFKTDLLWGCIKKAFDEGYIGTDDASLVERYSDVKVKEVLGDEKNIKITTPADLEKI